MQIDLNNFSTIEEIYEKMNIQSDLINLESDDNDTIQKAISSLANISFFTKRKDALYSLVGYYTLATKDLNDKEFFFLSLRRMCNYELFSIILQDISQYKNFYRKKYFVDEIALTLSSILCKIDEDKKNKLELVIENSVWGKKLKDKLIGKIKEGSDMENEKFEYLFCES